MSNIAKKFIMQADNNNSNNNNALLCNACTYVLCPSPTHIPILGLCTLLLIFSEWVELCMRCTCLRY